MSLQTETVGEPLACRTTGEWVRALSDGALETGGMLQQVSSNSEHCWGDAVGDQFRSKIRAGQQDAGALYDEVGRMGDAMVSFGDDLGTALATMNDARLVAGLARLPLTPTTIESPVMPDRLTDIVSSGHLDDVAADSRAREEYQAQLDAYEEAARLVDRARSQEQEAHDTLNRKVALQQAHLDAIERTSNFLTLINAAVDVPASTYAQSTTWAAAANTYKGLAQESRNLLDDPTLNRAARDAALKDFVVNQGQHIRANRVAASNSRLLMGLQNTAGGKKALAFFGSTAESLADQAGVSMSPAAGRLLRFIPVSGVAASGAGVALDLAAGESPEQAIASNGAAFALGTGTTGLLLLAGPGGWGTLAAIGAGVGMSWLANKTVDELMGD